MKQFDVKYINFDSPAPPGVLDTVKDLFGTKDYHYTNNYNDNDYYRKED